MTHVPYKGGAGQMIPAMMGNEVQFMFINLGNHDLAREGGPHQGPGDELADAAVPSCPDVPTVAEAGYPGLWAPTRGTACSRRRNIPAAAAQRAYPRGRGESDGDSPRHEGHAGEIS